MIGLGSLVCRHVVSLGCVMVWMRVCVFFCFSVSASAGVYAGWVVGIVVCVYGSGIGCAALGVRHWVCGRGWQGVCGRGRALVHISERTRQGGIAGAGVCVKK